MRLIDIDSNGRLTKLFNVLDTPGEGLFRMVVKKGECWEHAILPGAQEYSILRERDKITLRADKLVSEDCEFDISLSLVIQEAGDEIRFSGTIENRDDALICDLYYPSLGFIKSLGGERPMELLWPLQAGCRFPEIGKRLAGLKGRELEHQMVIQYPGAFRDGGSMGYLMLRDEANCLYLGNHDSDFNASTLRVYGDMNGEGLVGVETGRMALVSGGVTFSIPESVLLVYAGDFHRGAKRYRAWADMWFKKRVPPEWVRLMNGYFLVINKQQFRKSCWAYDTLPELYEHAKAHGLDVLGLFGWYDTGHDNGYPDLTPAPDLGGAEGLKAGLNALHAAGGRATLYYQGNLIDRGSDFYTRHGKDVECINRWGDGYVQQFDKALYSDFLRYFSSKVFALACPGHEKWRALMADKAREAGEYGADAVLYDQIGGMGAYPCFHPGHAHASPASAYVAGRRELLTDILARAEQNGGDFGVFSEHITDVYAQYLDCLHGMMSNPDAGDGVSMINFPELFRYTFPECIMTVRNALPYMQPRLVNYAVAHGMRFEMEIRYATDKEYLISGKTPEWTKYGHDMAALRARHADALLLGAYIDDEGVSAARGLTVKRFRGENSEALVVWNDTPDIIPFSVSVEGKRASRVDGVDGYTDSLDIIKPQELYVIELI